MPLKVFLQFIKSTAIMASECLNSGLEWLIWCNNKCVDEQFTT